MLASQRIASTALSSLQILKRNAQNLGSRPFSCSANLQATWGFIGLGQMGYPMALNLRSKIPKSDTLLVYDVNKKATAQFIEQVKTESTTTGVATNKTEIVGSERQVALRAETIITMLPQPEHVKNVYKKLLPGDLPESSPCRLFIDSSTIDVMTSLEVGRLAKERQSIFVDAPVSGGVVGARAGTLTFMLGAPESELHRINPILSMMGKRVLHCGDPGKGLVGKLTNNYLLAINNLATAEAMNMGIKLGLDAKILANLINSSTGRCWPSEVNNPVPSVVENSPASNGYNGGFGISLMTKDLKLAMAAALLANANMPLALKARQVYDEAEKHKECVGKDFSVIYKFLQLSSNQSSSS